MDIQIFTPKIFLAACVVSLVTAVFGSAVALMEYRHRPSLGPDALAFDIVRAFVFSLLLFATDCLFAFAYPEIMVEKPFLGPARPAPWTIMAISSIIMGEIAFIAMRARAYLLDHTYKL